MVDVLQVEMLRWAGLDRNGFYLLPDHKGSKLIIAFVDDDGDRLAFSFEDRDVKGVSSSAKVFSIPNIRIEPRLDSLKLAGTGKAGELCVTSLGGVGFLLTNADGHRPPRLFDLQSNEVQESTVVAKYDAFEIYFGADRWDLRSS